MRTMLIPFYTTLAFQALSTCWAGEPGSSPNTHPLMPGVRTSELWNTDWPRTLHDKLATGFSPLVCGLSEAPQVLETIEFGGEVNWLRVERSAEHGDRLLVYDGRLRSIDAAGNVVWTSGESGTPVFCGELRSDGARQLLVAGGEGPVQPEEMQARNTGKDANYVLVSGGSRLALIDDETGETTWSHQFSPPHVQVRAVVADILPELSGLEAAVFLAHGEEGCLINFPPQGEPTFVWRKDVVDGSFNERYDHGCDIRLDLSDPDRPVIWNVRRFRCRGYDARTGDLLSALEYDVGGQQRRNYGPWDFGRGRDGRPLICVVGASVQTHVHAIRLNPDGASELAWEHYYGEVYKESPGVAVDNLAIADMDGDGETEMLYTVRDPARGLKSFVRMRDADTGRVELELPDHWGAAAFFDVGPDHARGFVAFAAPDGAMPQQGTLRVYAFGEDGAVKQVGELPRARLWERTTLDSAGDDGVRELLLHTEDESQRPRLLRCTIEQGELQPVSAASDGPLVDSPIRAVLYDAECEPLFVVASASGELTGVRWTGETVWTADLHGGRTPAVSAADWDGDGRTELFVTTPADTVRVYQELAGQGLVQQQELPYRGQFAHHSPLLYDLTGDGTLCLLAASVTTDDDLVITAWRADGEPLWRTKLSTPTTQLSVQFNAGDFLPGGQPAVAVSVGDGRRTFEGTFLLDGLSGERRWFQGQYHDRGINMPYRSNGVPTATDFDADGAEDIGMDLMSYMAYLRGDDGGFTYVCHTPNIRTEGATYAGHLSNTFCPLYASPDAPRPHWLVTGGFGPFGVMNPDPTDGLWRVDLDYDVPPRIAMIDVDGDGRLEVGYAAGNSDTFICRDAWTGDVEWTVQLPYAPNSPALTADVDGDRKGEFLIGAFCIGTDDQGQGELRWKSPVAAGWCAIADLNGDGMGELICPGSGVVRVLGAAR